MISEVTLGKPIKHFFICINNRAEKGDFSKPSCGPLVTKEQVKEVKAWLVEQGLAGKIWVTATHCIGLCNPEGAVVARYPDGQICKGFQNIAEIKEYIKNSI